MAKKPGSKSEFVLFNVIYEDGSQRSNRRVPADILGGLDGDEPARAVIEQQDREIADKSGLAPLVIKKLTRVGAKEKEKMRG
ncbi:hypothetical protein [Flaviflagellibacter deserti]|uniref:Uncharacterized protein n=1 Tax=Flaviflagellibacter deserti TaxID=2267266 RepID=A0ABV9Z593_9HYPH